MAVLCYRVKTFRIRTIAAALLVDIETYTASPIETDIRRLLGMVCQSVDVANASLLSLTATYRCVGASATEVSNLLSAHLSPVVTASDVADIGVCLDWWNVPPHQNTAEWTTTEVGNLVRTAKYRSGAVQADALRDLADRSVTYVLRHPVLRTSDLVLAMPGSSLGAAQPGTIAAAVASKISQDCHPTLSDSLRRVRLADVAQKHLRTSGNQADANQVGTMESQTVEGKSVLLVDDTMAQGSSAREACRALRAAGASRVYSLTMAKDASGRRGYDFDLAPDHR